MPKRVPGNVYEVTLKIRSSHQGTIEILRQILTGIGIDNKSVVECTQWPHQGVSVYYSSKRQADTLSRKLRALRLKQITVKVVHLLKKDWQTKWKDGFKPFTLTKHFGVVPAEFKKKHSFKRHEPIYLGSGLAFGTGLHATTRFMAQFVERCRGRFESFMDIGTGTGILAIMASKCKCPDISAIDINAEAVKVARENFRVNNCPSVKPKVMDAHKLNGYKRYDFVCANIITQDLIEMASKIIRLVKPGKYLAVSGISLNSYNYFRKAYARYPLKCLKIEKGEGWAAILYKKKD